MELPVELRPTGTEQIDLSDDLLALLPKATPTFTPWKGPPLADDYGGKQVLDLDGEPLFAELVILRLFQRAGWDGVWVDTYRKRHLVGLEEEATLPGRITDLMGSIARRAGSRSGCFDVVAWTGESIVFAESKRSGRDRLRDTQRFWLRAALDVLPGPEALLVVEWTVR